MSDWGGGKSNDFGTGDGFGSTTNFDDQFGGGGGGAAEFGGGFDAAPGGGGGGDRACFNCGQEGHNKAECTNERVPREFTGTCRVCEKEGHMAKDCPEKPPQLCRNCGEEGHHITECKAPRKVDRSHIAIVAAEDAWKSLVSAVEICDMDDVKDAVQQYVKACPDTTYLDLDKAFRAQDLALYLVATKKDLLQTMTNMDFQGNLDKTYTVSYRFDFKPARPREADAWPKSIEENQERLKDAGEVVNRGLHKCSNCDELGHIAKHCPQEKQERERVVVKCFNCGEEGHRIRDCPEPRQDRFACKNCGKSGHKAADCTEERVAGDDVECRKCGGSGHFARDCPEGGGGPRGCFNCGQEGHMSKDCTEEKKLICRNCNGEGHRANECTEPKDMSKVQCRNCDEYGHESRQCPKPRDYSRVTCSNCGETGHTKVRCKKETVSPENIDGGGFEPIETTPLDTSGWASGNANGGNDGWAGGNANGGNDDWATGNTGGFTSTGGDMVW